ncbi:ligand-dependent corepressor-like [Gadus chalcogrammus]|uniref:ligand-dependent corepressor-like n=1 Tax=Gadus chalcogrammus TaxID=1042646 RepID=UPI0024C4D281|nr:ligand-dependent corepressor-like [Gadus chalcogrammus]
MASLCKRQQCTVERRGFRQELDSWRHKLIHCVGFESILEGLFGQGLVEDLKLFKACEPEAVSDWSFDENCLFCCLKRDKVKEHLVCLSNEGLEETVKPLLLNDQTKINRLEQQAEEFLNAVLCRKDVPSFSDPHIPVVAREIMQRMIRQFAAEYTSKTSTSQDPLPDRQPCSVQSLPRPPSYPPVPPCTSPSGAPPAAAAAHNQNPVLSKLLMADQEAPLDLTVKKPKAEPTEQDGVLDLSLRKNRYSSRPVPSPYTSASTPTVKGRSLRADGRVGLFMRRLQEGRRDNVGRSAYYKPFHRLAYSLHIKEEVGLAQESDPESPPSQNHGSRSPALAADRSPPALYSNTHFGALLKLRASRPSSEHLKDLPRLLEASGLWPRPLGAAGEPLLQDGFGEPGLAASHLTSFDLKIPQVRGLSTGKEPPWCSLENGLGKALASEPLCKDRGEVRPLPGAEKDYWHYEAHQPGAGGGCGALDSESDLSSKQPRKKRGRYRQYNTELLEEAIVVVMGGKMSVSKAQSVYGIPHSTLEYKVKERLGTLKHPPKKKLRLMSQAEDALDSHEGRGDSPEARGDPQDPPGGRGDPQEARDAASQQDCPPMEDGTPVHSSGLTPDEYGTMKPKGPDDDEDEYSTMKPKGPDEDEYSTMKPKGPDDDDEDDVDDELL